MIAWRPLADIFVLAITDRASSSLARRPEVGEARRLRAKTIARALREGQTRPAVGTTVREIAFNNVVLLAPFGPRTPTSSPGSTPSETCSLAKALP